MPKRCFAPLIVLVLSLGALSCQDMTQPDISPGEVAVSEGIPAGYGRLVSVTQGHEQTGWNLWFEGDNGEITRVWLSVNEGIGKEALSISRK